MQLHSLSEVISFDEGFKSAVNLYLSLNKKERVLGYIPTKSSLVILQDYLTAIWKNKEQATLLVGPYGKGKSHLLLVLLAIISMERNHENEKIIKSLLANIEKVEEIGEDVIELISSIWKKKGRFLPVLINNVQGDMNQSFLYALQEALKRENLANLVPDTYYSIARKRLEMWKKDYPDTYTGFVECLKKFHRTAEELERGLEQFSKEDLKVFAVIYPKVTAGGEFNPLAVSDVLPLYKSVSEKLKEEYGYSGIYIVFDEFSKFIEAQDGKAAGANMELVQKMCELAADSKETQIFITMVAHKSIKEYGKYLSADTINSYTGIEGRIIEKYFVTSSKNNYELVRNAIVKDEEKLRLIPDYEKNLGEKRADAFYSIPVYKSNFTGKDFESIVFRGCYPLNPISVYLLLHISEKVGQNERTLFTFISNDEPYSMARLVAGHRADMPWNIGADAIYDYFSGLFKKDMLNEQVHNEWLNAEYALSKCDTEEERKVIKALAVFLIINKEEEMPAIDEYLGLSVAVDWPQDIINSLLEKNILYRKAATNCLVFKTRAGSALKAEIKKQRGIKGDRVDYNNVLEKVSGKYYVIPRKYNTDHVMTRFFRHEYMSAENFMELSDVRVLFEDTTCGDGRVLSLYSLSTINIERVRQKVQELHCEKLLVVCPVQKLEVHKQVKDYEILQDLKGNSTFTNNHEVLKKEIPLMEEDLAAAILKQIQEVYADTECKVFAFYEGKVWGTPYETLEETVNICCERIYPKTPYINNELINRRLLTTAQTKKSRERIIQAILEHEDGEAFYGGNKQEATIYRSLFRNVVNGTQTGEESMDKNLQEILTVMTKFIDSCACEKKELSKLVEMLVREPYGLRNGVLPVYLARLLADRKEDIVITYNGEEIPLTAGIVIAMCEQPRDYQLYISGDNLQKRQYIEKLNALFEVEYNRNLSENRIKNILICMQRWFRALPQITRNVEHWEELGLNVQIADRMPKLKRLLQKADTNSFEMLFQKLPAIFGCPDNLEKTYEGIRQCKAAYEKVYQWKITKVVEDTYEVFGNRRKEDLYHLIREWYEEQSELSKNGLHGGRITNFMSCVEHLNVYDDIEVAKRLAKAVTDVYFENWNEDSGEEYIKELQCLKKEIEALGKQQVSDKLRLSFVGKNGRSIEKYYEPVPEGTGTILKNIIEDSLEEYEDLSVNDRVAILLEMIEKVIG